MRSEFVFMQCDSIAKPGLSNGVETRIVSHDAAGVGDQCSHVQGPFFEVADRDSHVSWKPCGLSCTDS